MKTEIETRDRFKELTNLQEELRIKLENWEISANEYQKEYVALLGEKNALKWVLN